MANQHGPGNEYFTSTLSFNRDIVPKNKLITAARAAKEAWRAAQTLINTYLRDGTIKEIVDDKKSWELFSADKAALDRILLDLKAALNDFETTRGLKGTFSLSESKAREYGVYIGEFFGEAGKLKELTKMINSLGGKITSDGRLQKVELPQGTKNPVTGADALRSVRTTFSNAMLAVKGSITSRGLNWDAYQMGSDEERAALRNQAVQIMRNEIAARPEVAKARYAGKEALARANVEATRQRMYEIIANNEEPILPATDVSKLSPKDKGDWIIYKKRWETNALNPAVLETGAYDKYRRKNMEMEADRKAKERFIEENPNSLIARKELAKLQTITNREEAARLFEAERTPGTPEFIAKEKRRLDRMVAYEDAQMEWAKNSKHPMAKALVRSIQKRRRNRTAGGRVLNKAMAVMRFGAIGIALSGIFTAVKAMVGFLSGLPAIGANVHEIRMRNARFNVKDGDAAAMVLQAQFMRLPEDVFSNALGTLSAMLAGPRSAENLDKILNILAPMSVNANGRTIEEALALFLHQKDNPVALLETTLSEAFDAYIKGRDELGQKVGQAAAGRSLSEKLNEASPAIALIFDAMTSGYYNADSSIQKRVNDYYAQGKDESGEIITWWDAVTKILFSSERAKAIKDLAPQNVRNIADDVHKLFNDVGTTIKGIWESLMINLLAKLEPVGLFAKSLLRWAITLPFIRDLIDPEYAASVDRETYEENETARERIESVLEGERIALGTYSQMLGIDQKNIPEMIETFKETGRLPRMFSDKGEQGFQQFLALILLQKGIKYKEDLIPKFDKEAENYENREQVHSVGGVSENVIQAESKKWIKDATKTYRENLEKVENLKTEEDWDSFINERKQSRIKDAKIKYSLWDMSDEDVWKSIAYPTGAYYEAYRKENPNIEPEFDFIDQFNTIKSDMLRILDAIPGILPASRYENMHAAYGSEAYGIMQKLIWELSQNGLLPVLASPETQYTCIFRPEMNTKCETLERLCENI